MLLKIKARFKSTQVKSIQDPKFWGIIGFIVSFVVGVALFTWLQDYRQQQYKANFAASHQFKNELAQYWLNNTQQALETQSFEKTQFITAQRLAIGDNFSITTLDTFIKRKVLNYKDPSLRNAIISTKDRNQPQLLFYEQQLLLLLPDTNNNVLIGLLESSSFVEKLIGYKQGYLLQESKGRYTKELFRTDGLKTQYNQALDSNVLLHEVPLNIFKQTWRLAIVMPPRLFLGNWVLLAFSVILSSIIGWAIYNKLARDHVIAAMLEQRAGELNEARTALENQSGELIAAREKALEASKAKGDFLANMSHEIRTPLNSMIGITELLLDTNLNNHQHANMRMVLTSAETLLEIINDILDFSKIESGKLDLEPISCDLFEIINDTAELFANRAGDNLQLLTHITSGTPQHLKADPVRLKQIICNLTSNAIKFTESGYVKIKVEELTDLSIPNNKALLKFSVEDTGIGIPDDKLQTIFEKFSQADVSTTRNFGGTGLGLSISQQLAEMMGGKIGVDSILGQGSTFWCTAVLEREETINTPEFPALQGKRLLVIDELLASTQIIEDQLSSIGVSCVAAHSGSKGLHILQTAYNSGRPFDAVIIDINTSDVAFEKIMRSIKASKTFGGMPCIALSATGEKNIPYADGYLHKPLDTQTLHRMLNLLFTQKNKEQLNPYNVQIQQQKQEIDISYFEDAEILLVDDNRANLMFGTELLEKYGCIVTEAKNGKIAVDTVKNRPFDLILMDCQMPIMDGFQASQEITQLKQQGVIKDIAIVALTANAMQGDKEKCLKAGMCDYIAKPIRKASLETVLRRRLPAISERVIAINAAA